MRIESKLIGGMQFESDIRGHKVLVDVPPESGGADEGPMPPELVVTALGTCVGIYAVNFCKKHQIDPTGMLVHTDWNKLTDPSRIGSMSVEVEIPAGIPEEKLPAFMKTIEQCMVHNSFCSCPLISLSLTESSVLK